MQLENSTNEYDQSSPEDLVRFERENEIDKKFDQLLTRLAILCKGDRDIWDGNKANLLSLLSQKQLILFGSPKIMEMDSKLRTFLGQ